VFIAILLVLPLSLPIQAETNASASTTDAAETKQANAKPVKAQRQSQQEQQQLGGGPWAHPDVLKAAAAIKMSPDQLSVFRTAIGAFVDDLMQETYRLTKQNKSDIPRRVKSKRNKLVKQLNGKMAAVLTEDQYSRYETYRILLVKKLKKINGK
jgi:hypothetical protein